MNVIIQNTKKKDATQSVREHTAFTNGVKTQLRGDHTNKNIATQNGGT